IQDLAEEKDLVILCGHYEGVDQRVIDYWNMEEVSIGDYILTGGELPAMVLVDSVARMLPEVLSSLDAALGESIYSGLLEYPQYTKPRTFEGMDVPDVLVSGNHKAIALWQFEKSLELTKERRPDLFEKYLEKESELSKDEKKILKKFTEIP
ncbi:MAG: tRNA (guanosine(37)-N1)-methyltransferase TrmD, partial [Firmicutes bacterium]|nr:tRNA (guanosine(37)-N1)-methyltransferase TrmD [Bacillota bacterium]